MKGVVAITHLATEPERWACLARLLDQFPEDVTPVIYASHEKESVSVWSEAWWRLGLQHALDNDATHILYLTDDVILEPGFWEQIPKVIEARPNHVISLITPNARFTNLECSWACSHDGLMGTAYVVPVWMMHEILEFRKMCLRPEARAKFAEDGIITLYTMATNQVIWHPLPSLTDHDTTVASTCGHDDERYRHPQAKYRGIWPESWHLSDFEDVGCIYAPWIRGCLRTHLTPEAEKEYRVIETMYDLLAMG